MLREGKSLQNYTAFPSVKPFLRLVRTNTDNKKHQGFRYRKGGLDFFLRFQLSLARALSSYTTLELAALIPNFALLRILFFRI